MRPSPKIPYRNMSVRFAAVNCRRGVSASGRELPHEPAQCGIAKGTLVCRAWCARLFAGSKKRAPNRGEDDSALTTFCPDAKFMAVAEVLFAAGLTRDIFQQALSVNLGLVQHESRITSVR